MHASSHPQHEIPAYFEEGNNGEEVESGNGTFWTLCPYCYYLYQYDGIYKDCCLRCQNCSKPFHGLAVAPPPPGVAVEGKDQYYCGIGYFSLKYNLGSSLGDKRGENVGIKDSFLWKKKGNNEGFKTNLENFVLISDDDDSDDDYGIGEKEECKNEKNCNVETQGEVVKNEDEAGPGPGPVLQRSNMGTEEKDGEMRRKRKVNFKTVARNTKKQMGTGIRSVGLELSGNTNAELREEDKRESQPENTGRKGSLEQEEVSAEDDLEFFMGEDDIYVGLKSII